MTPAEIVAMAVMAQKLAEAIADAMWGREPTNEQLTLARVASQAAHDDLRADIARAKDAAS